MKRSFQVLWPYMVKYRGGLVLGLGALVLKDLFAAAQPLVIGAAIDSLTREFALEKVLRFAALLAALSAIKGVFQYWMRVIIIGISRDVEFDLRNDLFAPPRVAFLGLLRRSTARATSWPAAPTI